MKPYKRSFPTARTIFALILREMATTYGRSVGGYMWTLVMPVSVLALMSIVFSLMLRAPSLGNNFMLFYATGYLPYALGMDLAGKISSAINFSKSLLAYPAVTFLDSIFARLILNSITHITVFMIVMAGLISIYDLSPILDAGNIITALALAVFFGVSIGTFNCLMSSLFPVYQQFWEIFTRPLFIISGALFLFDDVPEPYQSYLWYNPFVHIIGEMRKGFYSTYDASYASPLYVIIVSVVLLFFGLLFLARFHRDIINDEWN